MSSSKQLDNCYAGQLDVEEEKMRLTADEGDFVFQGLSSSVETLPTRLVEKIGSNPISGGSHDHRWEEQRPALSIFQCKCPHITNPSCSLSFGEIGDSNLNWTIGSNEHCFPSRDQSIPDEHPIKAHLDPTPGTAEESEAQHGITVQLYDTPFIQYQCYTDRLALPTATNSSTTTVTPSRRPGRRPKAQWAPDCLCSVQDSFTVKGTLWASSYDCQFGACRVAICRSAFDHCSDYMKEVYVHMRKHAKDLRKSPCQWEGCTTTGKLAGQTERNRVRHISTHIPWYTLCCRCGSLRARQDAAKSCASKICAISNVGKERLGMAAENLGLGLDTGVMTLERVWLSVMNPDNSM